MQINNEKTKALMFCRMNQAVGAAGHLKTTPIVEVAANTHLIMNNLLTHLSHTLSCFCR